jgi:hypothetical protein
MGYTDPSCIDYDVVVTSARTQGRARFGRIGEVLHGHGRAQLSYNDSNKLIDRMLHPAHAR